MSTPLSLNDPFTLFLFIIATLMMVGYAIGRWTNQRRARQISDWLEPGWRSLGGTPTAHQVSRSAFRLQMTDARSPFQTVTASVVLISREVLPTWAWERWHDHHDLLIIHLTLRQPPALEAEIVDPNNELGRRGAAQAQAHNWPAIDLASGWRLYCPTGSPLAHLESIAKRVAASPFRSWRLALRRNAPHLLLSMPVPDLEQTQSRQLAHLLTDLSKRTLAVAGGRNP